VNVVIKSHCRNWNRGRLQHQRKQSWSCNYVWVYT